MAAPVYYSADMVRALPSDGDRYETVHGELLVTPAPRLLHQLVVQRLSVALDEFSRTHGVGQVLTSPADLSWGPEILVQPDVFVVPLEEVRTLDWTQVRTLLLAVEVLSPTTARADRFPKRRLFQEVGVPLYWIVDPDAREAETWTPTAAFPAVERDSLVWHPAGASAPFTLSLDQLFRPA